MYLLLKQSPQKFYQERLCRQKANKKEGVTKMKNHFGHTLF